MIQETKDNDEIIYRSTLQDISHDELLENDNKKKHIDIYIY